MSDDMNARLRQAGRRRTRLGFVDGRLARVEPSESVEQESEEPASFGSADGGAHGPPLEPEPPSMGDMFRAAMMEKNASRSGWARLAQRERQSEEK